MKVWAGLVAVTLYGAVYCAVCCAQTSTPAKSVIGEVTSIDSAAKQVKLKGDDGGAYTVSLSDNTSFLRVPPGEKDLKKASKIAFSDVTVGDRALARGAMEEESKTVSARTVIIMTKGDLAQKHEKDRAEWQTRGLAGTVTALNAASKEVTITTRGRDSKTVTIDASAAELRRYAPDSVRFADAKPSSFADLQPGDTLRALGDKNDDGTRLKAEEVISGAFETIAGTVDSVDPASGEVHITNLQTKKLVVIRTNQNSLLRRLDPIVAAMLARRLRPDAIAGGGSAPDAKAGGGAGPGGSASNGSAGPQGAPGGQSGQGGFRGGFGGPGGAGGGGDLQQILERMPQLSLSELKKGDAVIVSSSKGSGDSAVTAFAFVAGVEPFLAAAPRTAGQVNLGSWNLDLGGGPEQ
jgi:Cu/Ag efflux protein CusF